MAPCLVSLWAWRPLPVADSPHANLGGWHHHTPTRGCNSLYHPPPRTAIDPDRVPSGSGVGWVDPPNLGERSMRNLKSALVLVACVFGGLTSAHAGAGIVTTTVAPMAPNVSYSTSGTKPLVTYIGYKVTISSDGNTTRSTTSSSPARRRLPTASKSRRSTQPMARPAPRPTPRRRPSAARSASCAPARPIPPSRSSSRRR